MIHGAAILFICLGMGTFTAKRLMRYLRYFQQEEYEGTRFISWIWQQRAFDQKGSAIAISICLAFSLLGNGPLVLNAMGMLALIGATYFEEDPRREGKVRLKMTERARRLYRTAFALSLVSLCLTLWVNFYQFQRMWLSQIVLIQLVPFWLPAASLLLSWDEKQRQKRFMQEARQVLADASPFVIGITGSYGKTSTKHALARILQTAVGPTFSPAKGINTPMGITQEIRAKLRKGYHYAVIEMGAYGRGSIQRLCDLTPPRAAIITHIGTAHLERFGSQETIWSAKAELAQAVPADGILVCNGDDEGARRIAKEYPKKTTLLYGFEKDKGNLNCWIADWKMTSQGTYFQLEWKGQTYEGFTPLFGQTSLSNLVAAFAMACALGGEPEYVLAAIHNLEPVDNRLQVQKKGAITYVNDAYNSNPLGFASALNVLSSLPGQRRIVMTPGMIELGQQQKEQNEKMGRMAARVCDFAIIVGHTNRTSLMDGLRFEGMVSDRIFLCDTRDQAFIQLKSMVLDGDIILIENDLVDLYEGQPRF